MQETWAAFGTLADEDGKNGVQATIPRALSYLSQRDQRIFLRKFKDQLSDEQQVMHTFRELLVGVFMTQQGHNPSYEPVVDGLTPDWRLGQDGAALVDVVNFHVERAVEEQIDRTLEKGLFWEGIIPDQSLRFRCSLRGKAGKYDNLVAQKQVPYVVFVYEWRHAVIERALVPEWLLRADGIFEEFPALSGVFHMYERGDCRIDLSAGYRFDYYANPKAVHPAVGLACGSLPYTFPGQSDVGGRSG